MCYVYNSEFSSVNRAEVQCLYRYIITIIIHIHCIISTKKNIAANDLLATDVVREVRECDDLVEQDTIRPDVRSSGEDSIVQGLWRHPAHRKHGCWS